MYIIHEYPHYTQYEVVRKGGAGTAEPGNRIHPGKERFSRRDSAEERCQLYVTLCGTRGD